MAKKQTVANTKSVFKTKKQIKDFYKKVSRTAKEKGRDLGFVISDEKRELKNLASRLRRALPENREKDLTRKKVGRVQGKAESGGWSQTDEGNFFQIADYENGEWIVSLSLAEKLGKTVLFKISSIDQSGKETVKNGVGRKLYESELKRVFDEIRAAEKAVNDGLTKESENYFFFIANLKVFENPKTIYFNLSIMMTNG